MPRGDGTGPNGMGSMTGRAAGYCAGYSVPGYANPVPGGRGLGNRQGFGAFGRGRGYRNMYYATGLTGWQRAYPGYGGVSYMPQQPQFDAAQEREMLNRDIEALQAQLDQAQKRLADLEQGETE